MGVCALRTCQWRPEEEDESPTVTDGCESSCSCERWESNLGEQPVFLTSEAISLVPFLTFYWRESDLCLLLNFSKVHNWKALLHKTVFIFYISFPPTQL